MLPTFRELRFNVSLSFANTVKNCSVDLKAGDFIIGNDEKSSNLLVPYEGNFTFCAQDGKAFLWNNTDFPVLVCNTQCEISVDPKDFTQLRNKDLIRVNENYKIAITFQWVSKILPDVNKLYPGITNTQPKPLDPIFSQQFNHPQEDAQPIFEEAQKKEKTVKRASRELPKVEEKEAPKITKKPSIDENILFSSDDEKNASDKENKYEEEEEVASKSKKPVTPRSKASKSKKPTKASPRIEESGSEEETIIIKPTKVKAPTTPRFKAAKAKVVEEPQVSSEEEEEEIPKVEIAKPKSKKPQTPRSKKAPAKSKATPKAPKVVIPQEPEMEVLPEVQPSKVKRPQSPKVSKAAPKATPKATPNATSKATPKAKSKKPSTPRKVQEDQIDESEKDVEVSTEEESELEEKIIIKAQPKAKSRAKRRSIGKENAQNAKKVPAAQVMTPGRRNPGRAVRDLTLQLDIEDVLTKNIVSHKEMRDFIKTQNNI